MIKDRRKSNRIPLQMSVDYLEENKQEWQNCFLVDVTYDGMGILLYMREAIQFLRSKPFQGEYFYWCIN